MSASFEICYCTWGGVVYLRQALASCWVLRHVARMDVKTTIVHVAFDVPSSLLRIAQGLDVELLPVPKPFAKEYNDHPNDVDLMRFSVLPRHRGRYVYLDSDIFVGRDMTEVFEQGLRHPVAFYHAEAVDARVQARYFQDGMQLSKDVGQPCWAMKYVPEKKLWPSQVLGEESCLIANTSIYSCSDPLLARTIGEHMTVLQNACSVKNYVGEFVVSHLVRSLDLPMIELRSRGMLYSSSDLESLGVDLDHMDITQVFEKLDFSILHLLHVRRFFYMTDEGSLTYAEAPE